MKKDYTNYLSPLSGQELKTNAQKAKTSSWYTHKLLEPFLAQQSQENEQKRKILDFSALPGSVSGRIINDQERTVKVEAQVEQFSEKAWKAIFLLLASKAYFLSSILSGSLVPEIEDACKELSLSLVPDKVADWKVFIDGSPSSTDSSLFLSLINHFADSLNDHPFLLFIIRGKGKEECIHEIKLVRSKLPFETSTLPPIASLTSETKINSQVANSIDFWKSAVDLSTLSYHIKADELPSAILRHLEPLPLGGIEDLIDQNLIAAYEKIARLAQSFALDLNKDQQTT